MTETTKNLLMLLLGLILGFLIGHFALPPECKPEDPGQRGEVFLPPSQLPEVLGIPEDSWPKVTCKDRQAIEILDEVFAKLEEARQMEPPRVDQLTYTVVLAKLYSAATLPHDPEKQAERCKAAEDALQKAKDIVEGSGPGPYELLWAAVIDDLEMDN